MATSKKNGKTEHIQIPPANMCTAQFTIRGTAPYVGNAFPGRTIGGIKETQEQGPKGKSKKTRVAKDFNQCYEDAQHKSREGWIGIPASGFRSAMIDACRLVGFKMTHAKLSVFIEPEGWDAEEGTSLVKIIGKPRQHLGHVRNETGVVDIRMRPMWEEWHCNLRVTYDGDQFSLQDVTNLLARAGLQVGVGEGRPNSKKSHGMGWGTFAIDEKEKAVTA
jgi:hypothetical protein